MGKVKYIHMQTHNKHWLQENQTHNGGAHLPLNHMARVERSPQQHLLPWFAFESTLGPTLILSLGGSMLVEDDSSDLLETMR